LVEKRVADETGEEPHPKLSMSRDEWVGARYEEILQNTPPMVNIQKLNERLAHATEKFESLAARFLDTTVSWLQLNVTGLTELRNYANPGTSWRLEVSREDLYSPICYTFSLDESLGENEKAQSSFSFDIHEGQIIYFSPGVAIDDEKELTSSFYVIPESYRIIPIPSESVNSFKVFLRTDIQFNLGEQYALYKRIEMWERKIGELADVLSEKDKKGAQVRLIAPLREQIRTLERKLEKLKIHLRERIVLEQISPRDRTLAVDNVLTLSYEERGFKSPLELIDVLERCCVALENIVFGEPVRNPETLSFFKDQILNLAHPRRTLTEHPHWQRNSKTAEPSDTDEPPKGPHGPGGSGEPGTLDDEYRLSRQPLQSI
jgi:hypothetical protein